MAMARKFSLALSMFWITLVACIALGTASPSQSAQVQTAFATEQALAPATSVVPVNPNASAESKAVLQYFAALSNDQLPGVISGQLAGGVKDIPHEFLTSVAKLHDQTGKWVGMITTEYEFGARATPDQLSTANQILIDYWQQGGLVSVGWAPVNPWTDQGNWPFDFAVNANSKIEDLLTPGSPVYEKWQASLARIADALTELRDAGVVVLWRPFYEMNGFWYWYGSLSHPDDPQLFVRLYRQVFDYLVKQRGLNNLLWVYGPSHFASCEDERCKPVDWTYPGNDAVDIVGGTSYGDGMRVSDYATYVTFEKPLILSEYSPEDDGSEFNNSLYAERLLNEYPRFASWTSWGGGWSLVAHPGAKELLNNPAIINRDAINWRQFLQAPAATP